MKTQHEQMSDELEAARDEIKRLETMLLDRHRSTYFRCPVCERVFPAVFAAENLDLKTQCCTDPICIRRTRFAERTAREDTGDDHAYDVAKEADTFGKSPKEELRFLGYLIHRE